MGNSINRKEFIPVAIPLMIPVVYSKPLNNSRFVPSAPPFEVQFTPTAPPFEEQFSPSAPPFEEQFIPSESPPFDIHFTQLEFLDDKSAYYRGLKEAIFTSRKALALDMIHSDKLTMNELYKFLDEIDKYMERFPKNKKRPIIRKMIVDKLNEMNNKTETSDFENMLNVIDEEIE